MIRPVFTLFLPITTLLLPIIMMTALLPSFSGCYIFHVGYGQIDILRRRRSIAEVREDPQISPQVRQKLEHIENVRRFARKRIGLNVGDTYLYYSQLDRSTLAWNVSASEQLSFRAKNWWFPIVGQLPYLGFFDRQMAEEEAAKLERAGWDVKISAVAAYSTLGWFDDPLVSPQLNYPDWYLAALLMHESSHVTLWFPGDVNFNESFASFVGETAALQYYREKGASADSSYRKMVREIEIREKRRRLFEIYAQRLDRLYSSSALREEKLQKKERILYQFTVRLKRERLIAQNSSYRYNNAHFLSYRRYRGGSHFFQNQFSRCKSSWPCFLKKMKQLEELDPEKRRQLLQRARKSSAGSFFN